MGWSNPGSEAASGSRVVLAATLLAASCPSSAIAQHPTWIKQFGTSESDRADALIVETDGGFYSGGSTWASLMGQHLGLADGWIGRFDASGRRMWVRQVGTAQVDRVLALAPSKSGGCFVAGFTEGDLAGPNAGQADVWIQRYDADGQVLWARQFGSSGFDLAEDAASDGEDGLFLCGGTSGDLGGPIQSQGDGDGWFARVDGDGNVDFLIKISSSSQEGASALAFDGADAVYVAGTTIGELAGPSNNTTQAWLARFDTNGVRKWVRQFGSGDGTQVTSLAIPSTGGICIGGLTLGALGGPSHGNHDAWVARFDELGSVVWIRQYGTPGGDFLHALGSHAAGGLWATGTSNGGFGGPTVGGSDAWLSRLDEVGRITWMEHLGSTGFDNLPRVAAAGPASMIAAGSTEGTLVHAGAGSDDVLLVRYDVCTAGSTYCAASTSSIAGCQASLRGTGSPTLSDPAAFTISTRAVPGGNLGLLLFGSSGKENTPFGTLGGLLCVAAPTFRTAPVSGGGDQGQCNGVYSFTLADLISAGPAVASGTVISAQVWARDPANQDGFLLSDGIEFTVCP